MLSLVIEPIALEQECYSLAYTLQNVKQKRLICLLLLNFSTLSILTNEARVPLVSYPSCVTTDMNCSS